MANCPNCAEAYGIAQAWRQADCGYCGLPVEVDRGGRVRTWASENADRILKQRAGAGPYILLGVGVVATVGLSLIPSLGILTFTVLPIIQAFVIERMTLRYKEHFGFLHATVNDFYTSLIFMVLILTEGLAGMVLESFAALVNAPLFLVVAGFNVWYCRYHFRQVANGLRPSLIELSLVAALVAVVIVPPTALLVQLITSPSATLTAVARVFSVQMPHEA